MTQQAVGYQIRALFPLLLQPPRDSKPFACVLKDLENDRNLEHYGYMSTVIERHFDSLIAQRAYPGVLLDVTSFTFYITTVKAIVEVLTPWHNELEFHTLMPMTPLKMFEFKNSNDINEWMAFLKYYNAFQDTSGIWKRYFAFDDAYPSGGRFQNKSTILKELRRGKVKTEEGSWKPTICDDDGKRCTVVDEDGYIEGQPLQQVLREFHREVDPKSKQRFCFVLIDDTIKEKLYSTYTIVGHEEAVPPGSFSIPPDIFAIRRKNGTRDWIFLIGREEPLLATTHPTFAYSPMVNLDALRADSRNHGLADELNALLCKIFDASASSLHDFLDT